MKGHDAQTSTMTNDQNERSPISHWDFSMPKAPRIPLAAPLGARMNRQTVAVTKDGSTYGMRNADRTSVRPRNRVLSAIAPKTPNGMPMAVVSSENTRLTQIEWSRLAAANASR